MALALCFAMLRILLSYSPLAYRVPLTSRFFLRLEQVDLEGVGVAGGATEGLVEGVAAMSDCGLGLAT